MSSDCSFVRWFAEIGPEDATLVGRNNTLFGTLYQQQSGHEISIPNGFAITAPAYRLLLNQDDLAEHLRRLIDRARRGKGAVEDACRDMRGCFMNAQIPHLVQEEIRAAYRDFGEVHGNKAPAVAVRASLATDLPGDAAVVAQPPTVPSYARGAQSLLDACLECYGTVFAQLGLSCSRNEGPDPLEMPICLRVTESVKSGKSASGTLDTIEAESGFPNMIVIRAGGGRADAGGNAGTDVYRVIKPLLDKPGILPILKKAGREKSRSAVTHGKDYGGKTARYKLRFVLSDDEILVLSRWAAAAEHAAGHPLQIEWGQEDGTRKVHLLQVQPLSPIGVKTASLKRYQLTGNGHVLIEGQAIGHAIAAGKASVLKSLKDAQRFEAGGILVASMTDPDWIPLMKRAAGIVTDLGGRTSHAAIVSRELGVPAILGTGNATHLLKHGKNYTISCAEGETGRIYEGLLAFEAKELDLYHAPRTRTDVMMIVGDPEAAMRWWQLPARGIGLARVEFIVNNNIKIHPMALVHFDKLTDRSARRRIEQLTAGYADKTEFFVSELAQGIATIAASQYPRQVIVRMSDFKSNEYGELIGGRQFEPEEENPMLGYRGASRYYSEAYRDAFALECLGLLRVRKEMGLDNVAAMIPFCRTIEEADRVIETMASHGLVQGDRGFKIFVMAEIPSNFILAEEFAQRFDGFSIGTNDLTQLILGVDRDSRILRHLFDERNPAVKRMILKLIHDAHRYGKKVGLCGQAPIDHPDFAGFMVEAGIDSIAVNPESILDVIDRVAMRELRIAADNTVS